MDDVVTAVKRKPVEDVVAMLKQLLHEAESGELRGFVFAGQGPTGIYTTIVGDCPLYESVGVIEALKVSILVQRDEQIATDIVRATDGIT